MDVLRALHGYSFNFDAAFLAPNPFALTSLLLFVWSFWMLRRDEVTPGFLAGVRLTWLTFLLPALTGIVLTLAGGKVPSAVDVGGGKTKFGTPYDPTQEGMHWLYGVFALLSLLLIESLIRGQFIERRKGLKLLPVVILFMYGCAYMVGHVAFYPGSTPGR
ncbi:hypothetical protein DVJ83_06740 [Deinococcus wulumuqiensis]|uniref:DUF2231 domain-containing protein n=1 Tax=Deinococcus wulumuqiensis TaxID=980427 RepID=A0A345IGT7_9DEIO|nr:hypothetical protein [Deinococcus wulumuqiensis]AXG98909.1 hypothetical protein DVJ83_06740 [Deinococcus wulumuqiensis]